MTSNTQPRDAGGQANSTIEDPQGQGKRYSRIFGALFPRRVPRVRDRFRACQPVTPRPTSCRSRRELAVLSWAHS